MYVGLRARAAETGRRAIFAALVREKAISRKTKKRYVVYINNCRCFLLLLLSHKLIVTTMLFVATGQAPIITLEWKIT